MDFGLALRAPRNDGNTLTRSFDYSCSAPDSHDRPARGCCVFRRRGGPWWCRGRLRGRCRGPCGTCCLRERAGWFWSCAVSCLPGDNARRGVRVPVCASPFINIKFSGFAGIVIPASMPRAYPDRVLSGEGALSPGDPSAGRARAGWTGAPRIGRQAAGGQGGAPGGAAPYVTGRARAAGVISCARWVRYSCLQGCLAGALAPPAAPPPPAWVRWWRSFWQNSGTRLRRESARAWLFEI